MAVFSTLWPNWAASVAACAGRDMFRIHTVRSERAISAQSIGITSRSGLAFHIWSTDLSSGSFPRVSFSVATPPASIFPNRSSDETCHQGLPNPAKSWPPSEWVFIQEVHRPSIRSGPGCWAVVELSDAVERGVPSVSWAAILSLLILGMRLPPLKPIPSGRPFAETGPGPSHHHAATARGGQRAARRAEFPRIVAAWQFCRTAQFSMLQCNTTGREWII